VWRTQPASGRQRQTERDSAARGLKASPSGDVVVEQTLDTNEKTRNG